MQLPDARLVAFQCLATSTSQNVHFPRCSAARCACGIVRLLRLQSVTVSPMRRPIALAFPLVT
eukprot:1879939-Prymnesium_polylepis.1